MRPLYACAGLLLAALMVGCTQGCVDSASWCPKLLTGHKSLSRCYSHKHHRRCCATCERMKLPIPDCPFGDRANWCTEIDKSKPVADCYAHNRTCCQTCLIYNSGIADCEFGDRLNWCSGIGSRYDVSSCYDHHVHCCASCAVYKTHIPGNPGCLFGDKMPMCAGFSERLLRQECASRGEICCESCHKLGEVGEQGIGVLGMNNTSTYPQTTTRQSITTPTSTSSASSTVLSESDSTLDIKVSGKPKETSASTIHTVPPKIQHATDFSTVSSTQRTTVSSTRSTTTSYLSAEWKTPEPLTLSTSTQKSQLGDSHHSGVGINNFNLQDGVSNTESHRESELGQEVVDPQDYEDGMKGEHGGEGEGFDSKDKREETVVRIILDNGAKKNDSHSRGADSNSALAAHSGKAGTLKDDAPSSAASSVIMSSRLAVTFSLLRLLLNTMYPER